MVKIHEKCKKKHQKMHLASTKPSVTVSSGALLLYIAVKVEFELCKKLSNAANSSQNEVWDVSKPLKRSK